MDISTIMFWAEKVMALWMYDGMKANGDGGQDYGLREC
jgi:hypothetical protein